MAKLVIKEIFRKKDFYVAFILIIVILLYSSSLQFYNTKNIVRYLMEIGLSLIFLFSVILTVSISARQVASEIQNRTCSVLLAKPISRFEFVLGKFLGSFFAGAACFTIFYAVFLLVVLQKGGGFSPIPAFQTFYLFLLSLLVLAAMAGSFSYYLTMAANVTTSIIIYLLVNTYGSGLKESAGHLLAGSRVLTDTLYYCLPHFEFFDLRQRFIHDWEPISAPLLLFLTVYAVIYVNFFLLLGWIKFRKQVI